MHFKVTIQRLDTTLKARPVMCGIKRRDNPNYENLSFANNTLIMFFKSCGQFAIETYRCGQSLEKYPGIFRIQCHSLMLLNGFLGLLHGTGQFQTRSMPVYSCTKLEKSRINAARIDSFD